MRYGAISPIIVFLLIFAAIGTILLFISHAASPYATSEAESGILANGASAITDNTASGKSAVIFNGSSDTCSSGQVKANDDSCVALPSGTTKLAFDDEFSSSTIDTSLWDTINAHGDRSNGETECYLPSQDAEAAGYLNITAKIQSVTCPIDSSNGGSGTLNSNYDTGALQAASFNFTYGTVQFRAKLPSDQGVWDAIWLLGSSCQQPNYLITSGCNWPDDAQNGAEIDMIEQVQNGSSDSTNLNMNIFNGTSVNNGNQDSGCGAAALGFDPSTAFHTYQFTWSAGKAVWSADGSVKCTDTTHIPSHLLFPIINFALGAQAGSVNASGLPQILQVDYFRVFQ